MNADDQVAGLETEYTVGGIHKDGNKVIIEGNDFCFQVAQEIRAIDPRQYDNPMAGRIYPDCGKSEGATPECAGTHAARTLALYMRAMDETMRDRFDAVITRRKLPEKKYMLFKSGTDWHGNFYGCHLNIRVPTSAVGEKDLCMFLSPFLASSIIWAGQGGIEPLSPYATGRASPVGFVFSPRALSIQQISGASANTRRGFFASKTLYTNTDDGTGWGRLQILTDPLFSDYVLYIYAGVILLIVRLLAKKGFPSSFPRFPATKTGDIENKIIKRFHEVARDPTLKAHLLFADGEMLSALDTQKRYYALLVRRRRMLAMNEEDLRILAGFGNILHALEDDPSQLSTTSEAWLLYRLANEELKHHGATWENAHCTTVSHHGKETPVSCFLAMLSYQITSLHKTWGIWPHLAAKGKLRMLFSEEEVECAKHMPPSSRARFRRDAYQLGKRYGIGVAQSSLDNWAQLVIGPYFSTDVRFLKIPDPTGRSNETYMAQLLSILEEIRKRENQPSAGV